MQHMPQAPQHSSGNLRRCQTHSVDSPPKICGTTWIAADSRLLHAPHAHTSILFDACEIARQIRHAHGGLGMTTCSLLPNYLTRGDRHGYAMHQQIRASATSLRACTTSATAGQQIRGECLHDTCTGKKETNRHVVIKCDAYNAARTRFTADTGITITHDNYTKVMAIDGISLSIPPIQLATALYRLLASIFRKRHATTNSSVAHSLGHNQGRFAVADTRQPHTSGIG